MKLFSSGQGAKPYIKPYAVDIRGAYLVVIFAAREMIDFKAHSDEYILGAGK
jgi:hypothetical protein